MTKKTKILLTVITLTVLIFSVTFAKQSIEKADLTFRNIVVKVDNKTVVSDTEPFIYEGRTYIPARALAETMGGYVEWDEETNTVKVSNLTKTTLSVLSQGIYYSMRGEIIGGFVLDSLNNLINHRNSLVQDAANTAELKDGHIATLTETYQTLDNFKNEWAAQFYLEYSCKYSNCNYEDLTYALNCYKNALDCVKAGFEALNYYNTDSNIALQNYAIQNDKAYEYYSNGIDIFQKHSNIFTAEAYYTE